MRGHLYCSPRCAREAGRSAVWQRVRVNLDRPIRPAVALGIVALAAAAPTVTALRAVARLERLETPARAATARRSALAPDAVIETVTSGTDGVRIEGRAADGSAVLLFSPSGFLAAGFAENGRFRFEGIQSAGPYRVGAIPLSAGSDASDVLPSRPAPPQASAPSVSGTGMETWVPDMTRGPRDWRAVSVTFDAGSTDRGAAAILDLLATRGLRATIFLTGDFIRRYPALTRRIAKDGHEVGNHTDTHPRLTTYAEDERQATRPGVDRAFLWRELAETARLFRDTTGSALAPVWRAPFGEHNAQIRRWAAEAGYWHVGWTAGRGGLDGMDWITNPASPGYRGSRDLVDGLVRRAENGGIVLLHLSSDRPDPVAAELPRLFDGLAARGFRFALASEFLQGSGHTQDRLASFAAPRAARAR
jgi:peptidoglycan/xylan/chitin deacetylase (PgdA/CDA1 family)